MTKDRDLEEKMWKNTDYLISPLHPPASANANYKQIVKHKAYKVIIEDHINTNNLQHYSKTPFESA